MHACMRRRRRAVSILDSVDHIFPPTTLEKGEGVKRGSSRKTLSVFWILIGKLDPGGRGGNHLSCTGY